MSVHKRRLDAFWRDTSAVSAGYLGGRLQWLPRTLAVGHHSGRS